MPGSAGDNAATRAEEGWSNEDGFLAADADEIAVSGATILFFDGDVQVADPFTTSKYNSGWYACYNALDVANHTVTIDGIDYYQCPISDLPTIN